MGSLRPPGSSVEEPGNMSSGSWTSVDTHKCLYLYVYNCMHIHIYIDVYIYTYRCMYMCRMAAFPLSFWLWGCGFVMSYTVIRGSGRRWYSWAPLGILTVLESPKGPQA